MATEPSANSTVEQILKQERPRRRWLWIAFITVAVIIVIVLFVLPTNDKAAFRYTTQAAIQDDLTIEVTATGTLKPLNQVDVGSEMSGIIDAVLVDFNDRVQQGQVLARLNTDEQRARVVQAQAALSAAEARVLQAQATVLETDLKLKRCQSLQKQGHCPPQDLDTAQAAHARADADEASSKALVAQAKATRDVEQTRLEKTVIRSPIDGIVLKRQIEPGQTVAASLQAPLLFTLAENLSQMELSVAVDEADIGKVQEGQHATFTVDAYSDQVFPAQLKQVRLAPLGEEGGVVSYETILSLNNEALLLRPGMTATAHIKAQELKQVLQVPNAALRFSPPPIQEKQTRGFMDMLLPRWGSRNRQPRNKDNGKRKQVWIISDGQPKAIDVQTGPSDGRMTHIISGELQAGTEVITDAVRNKP